LRRDPSGYALGTRSARLRAHNSLKDQYRAAL